MMYILYVQPVSEVLSVTLPVLIVVAYLTVAERKTMASMQRRLGPNVVGVYGSLQAFADALKLLLKEYVAPSQANPVLFFLGPIITLIFSLLLFAVIPFGPGLTIFNYDLAILFILALSSISTYGILLAGWSANSKYAFLGALRSTAQLISYELIITSAILLAIFFTGSLNLIRNVEAQRAVWFIIPLLPIFVIFVIGSIAETNRAPFDLAEAESELVSGFMTEHAAVIFVFFFLAEYASILFMCILVSLLFLGGYLYRYITNRISNSHYRKLVDNFYYKTVSYIKVISQGIFYAVTLGFKACIMMFTFIWVRASFPRIRYDQLMSYCWTVLLPLVIAFIVCVPCLLDSYEIVPASAALGIVNVKHKTSDNKNKPFFALNNGFLTIGRKIIHNITELINKMHNFNSTGAIAPTKCSFDLSATLYIGLILISQYFTSPVIFMDCMESLMDLLDTNLAVADVSDNPVVDQADIHATVTSEGDTSTNPENKPESNKPESNKPESSKPESSKPESSKPEVKKPEVKKPAKSWLEEYGSRMPPAGAGWGWGM